VAYVGILAVLVLDTALRVVAPDRFGLQWAPPDLPLITALYIGFRARDTGQLGLAVVLGLLADSFSARPLGHFGFLYGSAAYFALHVRRYVPPDAYLSHVVALFFCGLFTSLLGLLLAAVTVPGPVGDGFTRAFAASTLGALLAPFVFGILDRSGFFKRALGGRRRFDFA